MLERQLYLPCKPPAAIFFQLCQKVCSSGDKTTNVSTVLPLYSWTAIPLPTFYVGREQRTIPTSCSKKSCSVPPYVFFNSWYLFFKALL